MTIESNLVIFQDETVLSQSKKNILNGITIHKKLGFNGINLRDPEDGALCTNVQNVFFKNIKVIKNDCRCDQLKNLFCTEEDIHEISDFTCNGSSLDNLGCKTPNHTIKKPTKGSREFKIFPEPTKEEPTLPAPPTKKTDITGKVMIASMVLIILAIVVVAIVFCYKSYRNPSPKHRMENWQNHMNDTYGTSRGKKSG